jgi:hypothetical protein
MSRRAAFDVSLPYFPSALTPSAFCAWVTRPEFA